MFDFVDSAFTDFDTSKTNPIEVFLIDTELQNTAIDFAIAYALEQGVSSLGNIIAEFIAFAKSKGWVKNLPSTGGSFSIFPGNSERLLHFVAFTQSSGAQGCSITGYDAATNTFTLGGY